MDRRRLHTPMTDDMRYKVRRWLGYEMDDKDTATVTKYPHLKDWKPAHLRPGVARPERTNHDGGAEYCPSRLRDKGGRRGE